MYYSYGLQNMMSIVWGLASGTEELHIRVNRTISNLTLIEKRCLPQNTQEKYQAVRDFFKRTNKPDTDCTSHRASPEEYRDIAQKMCDIAFALFEQKGKSKD